MYRPIHSSWLWLLPAAMALWATASWAQPSTRLELAQALQAAQARSQQLTAQDHAASAAREMAVAAGQLPDPVLKAGIVNVPVTGTDRFSLNQDFMTMRSVGLMQELTRADKRSKRAARYEREAEAAQAARVLALAELRRETAMAWLERRQEEQALDLLSTQRSEAAAQVEAVDAAYRGGRGAQADVFEARLALSQIDERLQAGTAQLASSRARLARWVGEPAASLPLGALPDLAQPPLPAAELHEQVAAHHPQIEWLVRQESVAQAQAEMAQSNLKPDWSVELMYSQRGSAYSDMVSVNLSVPLQFDRANRQDREVAAQHARVAQLRAEREEGTRAHLADMRQWLAQWQGGRKRLAHYDRSLLPLAAGRTRATLAAYRGGGGSLATVLTARRAEIDIRIERLRLETETASWWARLAYLLPSSSLQERQP